MKCPRCGGGDGAWSALVCEQCQTRMNDEAVAKRAARVAVKVGAIKDQLTELRAELDQVGHFLGADHACIGLMHAQSDMSTALYWLTRAADVGAELRAASDLSGNPVTRAWFAKFREDE